MRRFLVVILGPTASGKSRLALALAKTLQEKQKKSVIINADSMQVYDALPLLTAQPTHDEKTEIPHSLYGYLDHEKHGNVARWCLDASKKINSCFEGDMLPVLVGGTGLYANSLLNGLSSTPLIENDIKEQVDLHIKQNGFEEIYQTLCKADPFISQKISPQDQQRIARSFEVFLATGKTLRQWQEEHHTKPFIENISTFIIKIIPPRIELKERIKKRLENMFENGAIDEVKNFLTLSVPARHPLTKAIGVPEITALLENKISQKDALEKSIIASRQYAKRQMTWFKHQISHDIQIDELITNDNVTKYISLLLEKISSFIFH